MQCAFWYGGLYKQTEMALMCCKGHKELIWKRGSEVACLLALLTVAIEVSHTASSPAPAPAPSSNKDFVTRNGSQLQVQTTERHAHENYIASRIIMIVRRAALTPHVLGFFP